jgi:hypothetical protein
MRIFFERQLTFGIRGITGADTVLNNTISGYVFSIYAKLILILNYFTSEIQKRLIINLRCNSRANQVKICDHSHETNGCWWHYLGLIGIRTDLAFLTYFNEMAYRIEFSIHIIYADRTVPRPTWGIKQRSVWHQSAGGSWAWTVELWRLPCLCWFSQCLGLT